jgi:hypothetical protein
MGAVWAVLSTVGIRALAYFKQYRNFDIGHDKIKNLIIIGSTAESNRVMGLLNQVGVQKNLIGYIDPTMGLGQQIEEKAALYMQRPGLGGALGWLDQLDEIVRIYNIEEIIFCSQDLRSQEILSWMTRLGAGIAYKIVPEESLSIIGSSSKNEPGELYTIEIQYNIAQRGQRRNKRVLDVLACGLLLLSCPIWLIFSEKRSVLLQYWLPVLLGRRHWIGYAAHPQQSMLPRLRPGVFSMLDALDGVTPSSATVARLNYLYAKDWGVWRDLEILYKSRVNKPEKGKRPV